MMSIFNIPNTHNLIFIIVEERPIIMPVYVNEMSIDTDSTSLLIVLKKVF